jgi:hypothetical protein
MVPMKVIVAVLLLLVCVAAAWFVFRLVTANTDGGFVTMQDFPALVSALQATGSKGSFWVVLVPGTARDDGYTANLQYSIEDNVVGMDWVLIAARNVEDRQRFLDVVHAAGTKTDEREGKSVRYLRATGARDLTTLGQEVLRQLYKVKPDNKLQLIISDFQWPKAPNATPTN